MGVIGIKEAAVDPYGRRQSDPQHKQNLVPQNPRLWSMLQNEARHKFSTYPSLPASKWIHNEYIKRGGIFVKSQKQDTRHDKAGRKTAQGKREEEGEKRMKLGKTKKKGK